METPDPATTIFFAKIDIFFMTILYSIITWNDCLTKNSTQILHMNPLSHKYSTKVNSSLFGHAFFK